MERGENSGAAASGEDIWAKLVPLDSGYPDVELRSDNATVLSVIKSSSSEKQEWCRIEKNKDQVSALMKNMCSHLILVDDVVIQDDDTATITCGSEIILGPEAQGFMRYRFKVMPAEEICKKQPQVISSGREFNRKRARAPPDEENAPCPQCGNEHAGFQCNQNTIHLQCQTCGGMMPSRSNASEPQHCLGCDRAFCGAYWHSLGVTGSDIHPVCSREILKPIRERTVSRIPFLVHEKNRHEQDITEKCIRHMGKSLQDVISEGVTKMNNREIDRTRLTLNHSEIMNSHTYVCNECYDKLVSFLLYWFRVTLPKKHLPPEALQRENCWYGSACRTQHHSEEHARKRNHVCRPTRGIHML